jgi:hypothetical protein
VLQSLIDRLTYSVLRLPPEALWAQAVNFFLYDSLKIIFLLFAMISVIGVLRTYIAQNTIKQWLAKRGLFGYFFSALFGAVTPFCSCSSIPIFISFIKAGIPLGITFSFLVTSPIINEYLVVLMLGFFGWKIALAYVLSGLVIGIVSGYVLGKMKLERHLEKDFSSQEDIKQDKISYSSFKSRLDFGLSEAFSITRKIWFWVLIGVGIGALIHNYIPKENIEHVIGKTGLFSVPIATLIGVPLYGSCAAIVPVAVALFEKGFPLGTVLSFMMAVSALSFPEAVMLRRAMRLELIAIFFAVTALAIILTGYLFNFLQNFLL